MAHPHESESNGDTERRVVLNGNTPVHVKFIGWLVIVCASGFGGWVWWASAMSTKLDIVISNQAAQIAAIREVVSDVARLKEWRVQVDTVGSPQLVKRVDELTKELQTLQQQFNLHEATTMQQKGKP